MTHQEDIQQKFFEVPEPGITFLYRVRAKSMISFSELPGHFGSIQWGQEEGQSNSCAQVPTLHEIYFGANLSSFPSLIFQCPLGHREKFSLVKTLVNSTTV